MKKRLKTASMLLASSFIYVSAYAQDVCLIRTHSPFGEKSVQCSFDLDQLAILKAGSATAALKEAFSRKYEIKYATSAGSAVEYLLIKN